MSKSPQWLTAIIILSLLLGFSGQTPSDAKTTVWQSKVDPWVLSSAAAGETEFLVFLSQQADLSVAAALKSKTAKGAYVYDTLTSLAESSQVSLRARLDTLGIPYQSYWVVNALWVRGDFDLIQQIAQRPDVAHVYANPRVQLSLPEPTSLFEPLGETAIEGNILQINADDVWGAGYTGQGVVIGGADTGYIWDHPALINQYRGGNNPFTVQHDYNWHDATGLSPAAPVDPYGHGTHTMGIMIGDDDGSNQIGVAPDAKWIGCRNMDSSGYGTPARYIECYQWFIAPYPIGGDPVTDGDPSQAPDVINNSWGCPPSEGCTNPDVLLAAVQAVRAAGIVTVHSAGNEGPSCGSVQTPASIYEESFSVGAINSGDIIASFSSRGPVTVDGSNRLKPNISAPGVNIRSSVIGDAYGFKSGTSMAAPHIAGVVALMISANPALAGQVEVLETLIEETAFPLYTNESCGGDTPTSQPNHTYGWGRVDAWAAYQDLPLSLLLNKTAPETIVPGNVLTYTLTVTNSHPFSITHNVILTDTVPERTAFFTATGNYSVTSRLITWNLGDLDAGASTQVKFSVRVPFATSGVITNDLYGARSEEVTTTVSGDPVTTLVHEPAVELSADQSSTLFDPCDPAIDLIYTHQITNTGNYTDTFYLIADSSQSWAQIAAADVTLAAGESAFFDVEIAPPCPTPPGTIDLTTISATSAVNTSVFDTLTDTTQIGYRLFFPLIFNGE